jgi:hypothetical protein
MNVASASASADPTRNVERLNIHTSSVSDIQAQFKRCASPSVNVSDAGDNVGKLGQRDVLQGVIHFNSLTVEVDQDALCGPTDFPIQSDPPRQDDCKSPLI